MGMPFPAAAAAIETQKTESTLAYEKLISEIETSLPGHETAANVLNLFTQLQRDKYDFFTLFQSHPSAKLRSLLEDTQHMVDACKSNDAMYFHPDKTGKVLVATEHAYTALEAWMQAQRRVYQFAAGAAYGDLASRSHG